MPRPRVLIFSTDYLPHIGGAEIAVKEITDRLPDYDFEMIVARLDRSLLSREKVGNIMVRRFGLGWWFDKYWLALAGGSFGSRLHKNRSYDLVWSIMASFGGFAALSFKKKNPSVPFLLTLQEGDELSEVPKKTNIFINRWRQIFLRADYTQSISSALSEWARAIGAKGPIDIIPNGVDLNKFQFRPKDLPGPGKQIMIVTTSRLVHKNGVDTLMESLTFLPDNFKLKICGDGPERKKLEKLTKNLGLERRVNFLGSVSTDRLPAILAGSDIFCRPSRSEGLGNSFLEAMAVGLPVVATPVGGIIDFLAPGETGWLAEPDHPKTVALAVREISDRGHFAETKEIVHKARALVEKRHDWLLIAAKMDRILKGLCLKTSQKS